MIWRTLFDRRCRDRAARTIQARIDPHDWQAVFDSLPFLQALHCAEREQLQARAAWLLACKTFNGAGRLELTNRMRLVIATQAALPILHLEPALYDGWDEVIVYPCTFTVQRSHQDESGVVHEYQDILSGEAWAHGPLILSWNDSQHTSGAYNVVIHEFAHKLDLQGGNADGIPALNTHHAIDPCRWRRVLNDSLAAFRQALDTIEAAIASDGNPYGPKADARYSQLPLDPYAATDAAEFFAVSSELFSLIRRRWPLPCPHGGTC
jgi:Mlc titration factor MtfA (ptsG expression regulator)